MKNSEILEKFKDMFYDITMPGFFLFDKTYAPFVLSLEKLDEIDKMNIFDKIKSIGALLDSSPDGYWLSEEYLLCFKDRFLKHSNIISLIRNLNRIDHKLDEASRDERILEIFNKYK